MPGNYSIPTNLPIKSTNGTTIANDWADMMDGTIITSLSSAGVTTSDWWSGVEADGITIGTSALCGYWLDNQPTNNWGNYGSATITTISGNISWLRGNPGEDSCALSKPLLCVAYP